MIEPNITLITLDYPPEFGGVARYLGSLVKETDGVMSVGVPDGHSVDGPGRVETRTMFGRVWPRWWPLVAICRGEKERNRTILVSHVFPVGTAALISKCLGGPDYSVIVHGLDVRLARGTWKRWLLKHICKNAKAVIANSESTKNDLLAIVPGVTVTVLTPAVDGAPYPSREDARRMLGIGPDEKVVLTVARLVPRKGVDMSIRAMARIQAKQDVRYVVIGEGSDRERLEQVATKCRTKVTWIRNVSDNEKNTWFGSADVFLLPVREDETDVEGFGIVYLEAAKAGIPSVAGKAGGAGEAVVHERTGLLVNPNHLDDITGDVERLLSDEDLRKTLGQQAKERVERDFRWHDRWAILSSLLGIKL